MEVLRGSAPLKKRIAERSRFILGSFYVLCFFTEALLRLQGAGVEQWMRKWLLGLLRTGSQRAGARRMCLRKVLCHSKKQPTREAYRSTHSLHICLNDAFRP